MRLSRDSGFNFHFFAEAGFCSILPSILESFWRPSWPLYSFLADLGAKKGSPKSDQKKRRQIARAQGRPGGLCGAGGGYRGAYISANFQEVGERSHTPAPLQAGGGGFNRSAHSAGPSCVEMRLGG